MMHGNKDSMVPMSLGQGTFERFKKLSKKNGIRRNDPSSKTRKLYGARITEFVIKRFNLGNMAIYIFYTRLAPATFPDP